MEVHHPGEGLQELPTILLLYHTIQHTTLHDVVLHYTTGAAHHPALGSQGRGASLGPRLIHQPRTHSSPDETVGG